MLTSHSLNSTISLAAIKAMVTMADRKDGHNNHDDGRKSSNNNDQGDSDNGGDNNDGSDNNDCKN
jgi:hypothetical protein